MFGLFKKKARKAIVEVKKMENRDAVEATVWVVTRLPMQTALAMHQKLQRWRKPFRQNQRSLLSQVRSPA